MQKYVLDDCDRLGLERLFTEVAERFGGVTYLLRAGGTRHVSEVSDTSLRDWQLVVEAQLNGAFHVCQAVLPLMIRQRQGAIVLNSSDLAVIGLAGQASSASANAGLYGLSKALALECAPFGIRVNAVGPGTIISEDGSEMEAWGLPDGAPDASVPMARHGRTDEVASVVEFLLSERAEYITGQLIEPNGGRVMW